MIKNYKQLNTSWKREKVLDIINAGFESLDIYKVIEQKIKLDNNVLFIESEGSKKYKYNLKNYSRLLVFGIGKGSASACFKLEKILGSKIKNGAVIDTKKRNFKNLKSFKGTHPVPSESNLLATKKIINMLNRTKKHDLVLFLIFGGGSALLCQPAKISLDELKKYTNQLLKSGKNIYEINTVRKHLSLVKGGGLAKLAYPATLVSCIFSDVPKNDLSFIASGPTVLDKTKTSDAKRIVKEFNWPKNIFVSTPKQKKYFKKVKNILVFSNKIPLKKMQAKATELGFNSHIYSYTISKKAKEAGYKLLKKLRNKKNNQIILAGGELTVEVTGSGKGGRNQEFVLGAISSLRNKEIAAAFASDGWDNTEAAGAIADDLTKQKAQKLGLNPKKFLENNDSFHFFEKTNDLIFAKPGINVSDLIIIGKFD